MKAIITTHAKPCQLIINYHYYLHAPHLTLSTTSHLAHWTGSQLAHQYQETGLCMQCILE